MEEAERIVREVREWTAPQMKAAYGLARKYHLLWAETTELRQWFDGEEVVGIVRHNLVWGKGAIPSLSHTTSTGRLTWMVGSDATTLFVSRPEHGDVLVVEVPHLGDPPRVIVHSPDLVCERHLRALSRALAGLEVSRENTRLLREALFGAHSTRVHPTRE
jgi:hypothetical protein